MPHRCPVVPKSIPEVHLTASRHPRAVPAGDQELEQTQKSHHVGDTSQSPTVSDGGIHVYAHQRSKQATRAVHTGSEEVGEALRSHSSPRVALGCFPLMLKQQREHRLPDGVSFNPFCWCYFSPFHLLTLKKGPCVQMH